MADKKREPQNRSKISIQTTQQRILLLRTMEDWRCEVDQRKTVAAVFIDLSKAFDSISHTHLLTKLQNIGITNKALSWFQDFLTNSTQRAVIDGQVSSWSTVQQRVPRGSLLGLVLFSIYTNDMQSTVSTSTINMYADDTALYASDTNPAVAAQRVSEDLSSINDWCKDNCLLINQSKTLAMFLSRNNKQQIIEASILLDGSPLHTVTECRYLGVLLESALTFKSHINSITLQVERAQNRAMRTILREPSGTRSQPLKLY